jgi:hypothetical protein
MTNRRDFLQGAALATVPLVAGQSREAGALEPVSAFHAVLVDARHAEALSFGARLASRGAPVRNVPEGDITSLWLSDIAPAWRRAPVALAGMTRPPVLFCLEQLAWAHGLRVVFHAEHVVEPASATLHAMHRPSAEPQLRGPLWPARIADQVAAHAGRRDAQRPGPSLAGLDPVLPQGAELLTSWIIAPA